MENQNPPLPDSPEKNNQTKSNPPLQLQSPPSSEKTLLIKKISLFNSKQQKNNNQLHPKTYSRIQSSISKKTSIFPNLRGGGSGSSLPRPISSFVAKNINDYTNLFYNSSMNSSGLNWTLNLRTYNEKKTPILNDKKLLQGEPSFYQEDLEKFKKRKLLRSKSAYDYETKTFPQLRQNMFLFKKNSDTHGTTITPDLLNYELNIRSIKPYNPNNNDKKNSNNNNNKLFQEKKWNYSTNINKEKPFFDIIYFPSVAKYFSKGINEKYILRPYKKIFNKIEYYDSKILQKKLIRSNSVVSAKLGEHYSLKPYCDKYNEKNFTKIENFLKNKNRSQQYVWFQLGLRNGGKDKINENDNKNNKGMKKIMRTVIHNKKKMNNEY